MKGWAMALLCGLGATTAQAKHTYPNYYKNVDHLPPYEQALSNDDWYMPTAQQRALVSGLLTEDLVQDGLRWKVQQMVYDPNFYQGIRRVGSETACLMFRYTKGFLARPTCTAAPIDGEQIEAIPFASKKSQYFKQPLIINSPIRASKDDELRYEFWIPAGMDYKPNRHYYPIHQLGHNKRGANNEELVINAFLTVYENKNGKWRKLKLSNKPLTLAMKIPSLTEIRKNKTAQQAYRQAEHSVRILDSRE
ncbi:hypothetical protein [uncultured Ferrimonas sp.]|uniref:hypothetical protein n=1 Tax=uncultured Ferrimonas sp. TaxID=432640 RepID=UPI0026301B73|nr:hypothetical protein [uncultured Ferrimonas sp.]